MPHIVLTSDTFTADAHITILDRGDTQSSVIRVASWMVVNYVFIGSRDGVYERVFILETGSVFHGGGVLFAKNITYQGTTSIIGDRVISDLSLLWLATDQSQIDIRGISQVGEPYRQIHTRVDQTNILIGNGAKIRGMPVLEVATDDVDGGHSCRVHRIAGEALFYLQSRGLDATTAEWLLIDGELRKHTSLIWDCDTCDQLVDEIRNSVFL